MANLRAHRLFALVLACDRHGHERDQRARGGELGRQVLDFARVVLEHFPHGAAYVASRQRVVADEGNAVGRQVARDQRHHEGAHLGGNP